MEKQKEFDRTSDACLDCIHMLAVIDGANWMITDVAHKYADFLTEDDKKKLDETAAMTKLNYFYNNSMKNSGVDTSFFNPDSGDFIDISKRMQNIASM